jgi:hypothetical protein
VLAKYDGEINKVPHTTDCTSSLGAAIVRVNDCHYVLTGNTDKEHPKASGKFDAKVWIVCPPNKEIEITDTASDCLVKVPTQTPTEGGVIYKNEVVGGKKVVKVEVTVTGVTYTTSFVCQVGGLTAEDNNADYTGTVVVSGFEDKNKTTTDLTEVNEGAQIEIEVS